MSVFRTVKSDGCHQFVEDCATMSILMQISERERERGKEGERERERGRERERESTHVIN